MAFLALDDAAVWLSLFEIIYIFLVAIMALLGVGPIRSTDLNNDTIWEL